MQLKKISEIFNNTKNEIPTKKTYVIDYKTLSINGKHASTINVLRDMAKKINKLKAKDLRKMAKYIKDIDKNKEKTKLSLNIFPSNPNYELTACILNSNIDEKKLNYLGLSDTKQFLIIEDSKDEPVIYADSNVKQESQKFKQIGKIKTIELSDNKFISTDHPHIKLELKDNKEISISFDLPLLNGTLRNSAVINQGKLNYKLNLIQKKAKKDKEE